MKYKKYFISKTKTKMTVTDNLQSSFDKNREPHLEKLELLRAL
jgi:hypothetical protein